MVAIVARWNGKGRAMLDEWLYWNENPRDEETAMKSPILLFGAAAMLLASLPYRSCAALFPASEAAPPMAAAPALGGGEEDVTEEEVRAIFVKAQASETRDGNISFCGFYPGMSPADARVLARWYYFEDDEWTIYGNPVDKIHIAYPAVQRMVMVGSAFNEITRAVTNRVGAMQRAGKWGTPDSYVRRTPNGLVATFSKAKGFRLEDARPIFAKAKMAAERDGRPVFGGFFAGMSALDARALAGWHALENDEWSQKGNPVYELSLAPQAVSKVAGAGESFEDRLQAVSGQIGPMQPVAGARDLYERKTPNGDSATLSAADGFSLFSQKTKDSWQWKSTPEGAIIQQAPVEADSAVAVPAVLDQQPVIGIGRRVFADRRLLASVTLPDTVTAIGEGAFSDCPALAPLKIPGTVTDIGKEAFRGCSAWTSISLPASATNLGAMAFAYCQSLTSARLPDGLARIEDGLFNGCQSLASVDIPESVTSIGAMAFSGCRSLTSPVLPESVTNLGAMAFSYCPGLTSVTLPANVVHIGDGAFDSCENLAAVTLPGSVTSIENMAFAGCRRLETLTIPDSVSNLGRNVFSGCTGLKRLSVPGAWKGTSILDHAAVPDACEILYR